jgi:rare lipoprotein A
MIFVPPVVAAEKGIASHYPYSYLGRRTASGERFDPRSMTCAHKRHPFGSMLRVSKGERAITCRVTDRGPFVRGRVIDLTPVGARALGISGLGQVTVERL